VNHFIVVEVDQPLSDTYQLEDLMSSKRAKGIWKWATYKPKPVCFRAHFDELIDISLFHPP
jgi:hypothetical protein